MRKILSGILMIILALTCVKAFAVEVVRQKNVASYIVFPLVDADGDLVTSAGSLDSEIDTFADGSAPDGFADCTNEATEIGTTGNYYLSLTNTELNVDYAIVQVKSTSGKTQVILIRTMVGDPLNFAVTDDGGVINVTGGAIDTVTTTTTATNVTTVNGLAANVITASAIATDAIGADEIAADAIGSSEIATDAIGAAEVAASALTKGTEIAGFNDLSAASVNAEVDTALGDYDGPTYTELLNLIRLSLRKDSALATDLSSLITTVNADLGSGGGAFANTTDSQEGIRDNMGTAQTGDSYARLGAPAGASVSADIAAVKSETASILDDTGTSGVTVQELKVSALADMFNTDSGTTYASAVAGSVVKETADNAGGSSLTLGDIADAVWDEALSGHSTAGTAGKKLSDLPTSGTGDWTANEKTEIKAVLGVTDTGTPDNTPASGALYEIQGATFSTATDSLEALRNRGDATWITATGFSTHSAADVWSAGTRTLTALDEDSTTIDLDASAVGSVTGNVGGNVTGSIGSLATQAKADVNAEVDSALDTAVPVSPTANSINERIKTIDDAYTSARAGNLDYLDEAISGIDDNPWDAATRTLTANTNLNDPTAAAIADAVWDEAQSGHVSAGTFGYYLDAQVSSAAAPPSAASIADAVWDEAISGHTSAGTTGEKLNSAASAGDPWSTAVPGAYSAGTAGYVIGQIKDATDGDTESGSYTGIENTIRINR